MQAVVTWEMLCELHEQCCNCSCLLPTLKSQNTAHINLLCLDCLENFRQQLWGQPIVQEGVIVEDQPLLEVQEQEVIDVEEQQVLEVEEERANQEEEVVLVPQIDNMGTMLVCSECEVSYTVPPTTPMVYNGLTMPDYCQDCTPKTGLLKAEE